MDWPSLVDTATRALLNVSDGAEISDSNAASSNNEPLANWVDDVAERLGLDRRWDLSIMHSIHCTAFMTNPVCPN